MWKRRPPATETLERGCFPWLLACVLATVAPHASHLPPWLAIAVGAALLFHARAWRQRRPPPPRWLLLLVLVVAAIGIHAEYRTLFGRDAGVAMLVLLATLKPFEARTRRDAIVVVMLGFFLLLTHYFYSQSIATGLWLLAAATLQTATLLRLFGGPRPLPQIARQAAALLLQASPFMLVLFLLFPRVSGPLWGLPQDAHSGRSGLSESMAPGDIANLVQNGEIAFRARFAGPPPANSQLYWRGPVMDEFDGRSWRTARLDGLEPARIEARGEDIDYEITLEPHNRRWLLALDAPLALPGNGIVGARGQALAAGPVRERSRFALRSAPDYRMNVEESRRMLALSLRLPASGNPRARALAAEWKALHAQPQAIVEAALQRFQGADFVYTLQPPLLGEDSIDEFVFDTRQGFCEHYASSFVFLMRAAGVPARVVAGYQGGEINPVDGYLVVRQSDAHAWAEVWIAGEGWRRVDPTAANAPARIARGIASALPENDALPAMARTDLRWLRELRFRLEAVNNAWNQWVPGYNPERQRAALSRLGFGDIDWRGMTALLAAACALILAGTGLWLFRREGRRDPLQGAWLALCARLARHGLRREDWEGPLAYAARVGTRNPGFASTVHRAATAYAEARYGTRPAGEAIACLREARRQLPGKKWSIA